MVPVLPRAGGGSLQSYPGLMDERSCLKGMVRALTCHFASSQTTELLIDGRKEISCCTRSFLEAAKDTSNFVQGSLRFRNRMGSVN